MPSVIHLAIWLVCFYDAVLLLLLPSTATLLLAPDGSAARHVVTVLCLGIGAYVLNTQGFNRLPSRWVGWGLVAMAISAAHSPNISFESLFVPKDSGIYNYKPMFEVLVFFLLFMAVYTARLDPKKLYQALAWVGLISAGYIILQHLGLDQLYRLSSNDPEQIRQFTRNPKDGAFIGQPVFAGCLVAMCLPFLYETPEWLWARVGMCLLAIGLTGNRTSALAAGIVLLAMSRRCRWAVPWVVGAILMAVGVLFTLNCLHHSFEPVDFTGRLEVWRHCLGDLIHNPFPGIDMAYILTGMGLGNFVVTYPFYHHSGFYQAHNEYLELFRGLGILGAAVVGKFMIQTFRTVSYEAVEASLLAVAVCAFFNPVWHNAQLQFLTVVLLAIHYKGVPYDLEDRAPRGGGESLELREHRAGFNQANRVPAGRAEAAPVPAGRA